MPRTKGELAFIDQYTRKLLVDWANVCIQRGDLPDSFETSSNVYVEHALEKGWLTKRTPRALTAKGWSTAAAFLKR
jgi:hypothetical protein